MPYDPIAGIRGADEGAPLDQRALSYIRQGAAKQQRTALPIGQPDPAAPAQAPAPARGGFQALPEYTPDNPPPGMARDTAGFDLEISPAPDHIRPLLEQAEAITGVPASILEGVGYNESRWREDVINGQKKSGKGAAGMMQFTPIGIKEATRLLGRKFDPLDPQDAAIASGTFLKHLYGKFDGDWTKALAAYNWGEARVRSAVGAHGEDWLDAAPEETKQYVRRLVPVLDVLDPQPSATLASTNPEMFLRAAYRPAGETSEGSEARGASLMHFNPPGNEDPAGATLLFDPSKRRGAAGKQALPYTGPFAVGEEQIIGQSEPRDISGGFATVLGIGGLSLLRNVVGTVNMSARALGFGDIGGDAMNALAEDITQLEGTLDDQMLERRAAQWSKLGEGSVWSDPGAILVQLVENFPNFFATLGTGVATGLIGSALKWSPKLIGAVASATGAATEGTIVTGVVYSDLVDGIRESDDAGLMVSPMYKEFRDGGMGEEEAKEALIDALGPSHALPAGGVSAVLGGAATGYIGKLIGAGRQARMMRAPKDVRAAIVARTAPGTARRQALKDARVMGTPGRLATAGRGAMVEGITEAGQEGQETIFGNLAAQKSFDPGRGTTEGVGEAMAAGAGLGAIMGAGPAGLAKKGALPVTPPPPAAPAAPTFTGPSLPPNLDQPTVQRRAAAPTATAGAATQQTKKPAAPAAPAAPAEPAAPAAPAAPAEPAAPARAGMDSKAVQKALAGLDPVKSVNNVARAVRGLVQRAAEMFPDASIPTANRQRSAQTLAKLLTELEAAIGDTYPGLAEEVTKALATKDPGTAVKELQAIGDRIFAEETRRKAGVTGEVTSDPAVQLTQAVAMYDAEVENLRRARSKGKKATKATKATARDRAVALESVATAVENALNAVTEKNAEVTGTEPIRQLIKQVRKAAEQAQVSRKKATGNTQTDQLPVALSHRRQDVREDALKTVAAELKKALAGEEFSLEGVREAAEAVLTKNIVASIKKRREAKAAPKKETPAKKEADWNKTAEAAKKKGHKAEELKQKAKEKKAAKQGPTKEELLDKAEKRQAQGDGKKPAASKPTTKVQTKGEKGEEIKRNLKEKKEARAKVETEQKTPVADAVRAQHKSAAAFIGFAKANPIETVRGLAKTLGLKITGTRAQIAKRVADVVWVEEQAPAAEATPEPTATQKPDMVVKPKPVAPNRGIKTMLMDAGFGEDMVTVDAIREEIFPDFNQGSWRTLAGFISAIGEKQAKAFQSIWSAVVTAETNNELSNAWLHMSAWMEDINGRRVPDSVQVVVRDFTEQLRNLQRARLAEQTEQVGEAVADESELTVLDDEASLSILDQEERLRFREVLAKDKSLSPEQRLELELEMFGKEVGTALATQTLDPNDSGTVSEHDYDYETEQEFGTTTYADTEVYTDTVSSNPLHRSISHGLKYAAARLRQHPLYAAIQSQVGWFGSKYGVRMTLASAQEEVYKSDPDPRAAGMPINVMLEAIVATASENNPVRRLAQKLIELNLGTKVHIVPDLARKLPDGRIKTTVSGTYLSQLAVADDGTKTLEGSKTDEIYVQYTGDDISFMHALLHEAVHAATLTAYQIDAPFRSQVDRLFKVVTDWASANGITSKDAYGLIAPYEMLAEVFTNPDFQALLLRIPATKKQGHILSRFLKAIIDYFGLRQDGVTNTLFAELVLLTESHGFWSGDLQSFAGGLQPVKYNHDTRLFTNLETVRASSPAVAQAVLNTLRPQSTWDGVKSKLRDGWLQFHTLTQVQNRYARFFDNAGVNNLKKYIAAMHKKRSVAHQEHAAAEKINSLWRQLSPDQDLAVSQTMMDATMWQVDPRLTWEENTWLQSRIVKDETANKAAYDKIVDDYNNLSPEAQKVFNEVTTYFKKQRASIKEAFIDNVIEKYQIPLKWREFLQQLNTAEDIENFMLAPNKPNQKRISSFWFQVGEEYRERFQGDVSDNIGLIAKDMRQVLSASSVNGVYVPLRRYGDFVVTVGEENNASFGTHEEADDFANDMRMRGPENKIVSVRRMDDGRWTVDYTMRHIEFFADEGHAKTRGDELTAMGYADVMVTRKQEALYNRVGDLSPMFADLLRKFKDTPELQGQLKVAFTEMLAGNAMQAAKLKRKNFTGAKPKEMRQAFAERAYSGGWYLADLLSAEERRDTMVKLMEDARDSTVDRERVLTRGMVVREVSRREKQDLQDRKSSPVSDAIAKTGFMWFLFSPAYSLINATQVSMYTLPYLGGRFGFRNSTREIGRAYKQVLGPFMQGVRETKAGLAYKKTADVFINLIEAAVAGNADEKDMLNKVKDRGLMEVTFMQEIADTARGIEGTAFETGMQIARTLPQGVEVLNRVVTALASYRLARQSGLSHEKAIEVAFDANDQTQLDYSMQNRPPAFKFPGGRAIMLFKMFGQGVYNLLISNAYDAITGAGRSKKEARRILGGLIATHTLTAGVLGGIMLEPLRWVINAAMFALGDDDEPFDIDFAVRDFMVNGMGMPTKMAQLAAEGLPNLFNVNLYNRLGAHQLMFMGDFNLSTDATTLRTIGSLVGPAASMALAPIDATRRMSEGDIYGGIKQILPAKVLRDLMTSYEMGMEGLSDRRGMNYAKADEFGFGSMAVQAFGITPTTRTEITTARRQATGYERFKTMRKRKLQQRWHNAGSAGERMRIWREEIQPFNRTVPGSERVKMSNLYQTARERRQEEREAARGGLGGGTIGAPRLRPYNLN